MTCDPTPLRFVRSPDSALDYTIDWSGWLAPDDSLTQSTWAPVEDPGLTVVHTSFSTSTTSVWVSGGEAGTGLIEGFYPFAADCSYYHLINTVTTALGRIDERRVTFTVKNL